MNPIEEGFYALRVSAGPVTRWMVALVVFLMAVVGIGSSAIYLFSKDKLDKAQNQPAQTVPVQNYVAAVTDVFQCLREGQTKCSYYAKAEDAARSLASPSFSVQDAQGSTSQFSWTNQPAAAHLADKFIGSAKVAPTDVKSTGADSGSYATTLPNGQKVHVNISLVIGDKDAHVKSVQVTR